MFDRLCHRIVSWIVYWICHHIAIGGHCGLCGKWVPNELLPAWWRVTICDDCAKENGDEALALEVDDD